MSSYRRYVAGHGAATGRAKRQILRHALESGPDHPAAPLPIEPAWCLECLHSHAQGVTCRHAWELFDLICGCTA